MIRNSFYLLTISFLFCCFNPLEAQKDTDPKRIYPKNEMRGVWITTVFSLDYPRKPTSQVVALKEDYRRLLDELKDLNMNAVFMQVRPAGDALYPSQIVPWSSYLTGQQGKSPLDGFDPLAFMIEETHKRGMEFHAWLNPYRVSMNTDSTQFAIRHVYHQHRNWLFKYGNKYYLKPQLPEVRQHITDVTMEIVNNYNIDGIHFDDYFYPYPKQGEIIPDSLDYNAYAKIFKDVSIADWRREQVNLLIEKLHNSIKQVKPNVQFGISPFGVWRNKNDDPFGSATTASIRSYDDLYADILLWMQKRWIDYVAPQIYWSIGFEPADYRALTDWWSTQPGLTPIYIGQAAYKVGTSRDSSWLQSQQIDDQVFINRKNRKIKGSIYFRAEHIITNKYNLKNELKETYAEPALLPVNEFSEDPQPHSPNLRKIRRKGTDKAKIKWKSSKEDMAKPPYYYVIYKFEGKRPSMNFSNPEHIFHISAFNEIKKKYLIIDEDVKEGEIYTYVVRAVNKAHKESPNSTVRSVIKTKTKVKKIDL